MTAANVLHIGTHLHPHGIEIGLGVLLALILTYRIGLRLGRDQE